MKRFAFTLALGAGILSLAMISGCSRQTEKTTPSPQPATIKTRPDRVEIQPESTGELSRRYIHGGLDGMTVVELRIAFKNGETGYQYFRDDKTVSEVKEEYSNKKVKSQAFFADDGKAFTKGSFYRPDGTIQFVKEVLADGSIRVSKYWMDGKYVFWSETRKPDGTRERFLFRPDGQIWARVNVASSPNAGSQGLLDSRFYDIQGKLVRHIFYRQDGFDVMRYRTDGSASHRQSWKNQYDGSMPYQLETVEEYAADGKTLVRKFLVTQSQGSVSPREIHLYKDGVKTSERFFRAAVSGELQEIDRFPLGFNGATNLSQPRFYRPGTVEREVFFDAAGNKTKEQNYEFSEDVTEKVESNLLTLPRDFELDNAAAEFSNSQPRPTSPLPGIDLNNDPIKGWYQGI